MSDHTPHEHDDDCEPYDQDFYDQEAYVGPICVTCESCEACCECPTITKGPWVLLALCFGVVGLYAAAYTAGWLGLNSGWAFLAGLAAFFAGNAAAVRHWAIGLSVSLAAVVSWQALAPDELDPSFVAGAFTPLAAAALVFGTWVAATVVLLRRDRKAANTEEDDEVKVGLNQLEAYVNTHHDLTVNPDGTGKFIGLSGYAGVGKDTVAAELLYNDDYTRVSFADPIRALALAVNGDMAIWPGEFGFEVFAVLDGHVVVVPLKMVLEAFDGDWTKAKQVPAVRKHLQGLGVGVRDVLGEDTWVDAALATLPPGPIVVTDCRFPNEAQAIKDAGGYVVRVHRPGVTAANAHITDTALDGWDFDAHIINEGTPAEARTQMRLVEEVLYDRDDTGAVV